MVEVPDDQLGSDPGAGAVDIVESGDDLSVPEVVQVSRSLVTLSALMHDFR